MATIYKNKYPYGNFEYPHSKNSEFLKNSVKKYKYTDKDLEDTFEDPYRKVDESLEILDEKNEIPYGNFEYPHGEFNNPCLEIKKDHKGESENHRGRPQDLKTPLKLFDKFHLEPMELYQHFLPYVLLLEELSKNGFPLNNTDDPGKVVLNEYWKKKVSEDPPVRCCCRCGTSFVVLDNDAYLAETDCYYHSGRRQYIGGISGAGTYSCCGRNCKSDGCTFSEYHVSSQTSMSNAKFVQTKNKQLPNSSCQVYALDCKKCYTVQGLKVAKISIVGTDGLAIYDKYVLPEHLVVDYNTKYSGITANDLKECTTTLADVQADLLKLLDASTILVGHGLENDLKALRLIHETIVDTSFVFPHKYGLPYKRSLKSLASSYLKRTIRKGEYGHDSVEDARTCMELMLWKIEFDSHHFIQPAKQQYIQPTIKQYVQSNSQQYGQSDSQQYVQSDGQQYVQPFSQQYGQPFSQQYVQKKFSFLDHKDESENHRGRPQDLKAPLKLFVKLHLEPMELYQRFLPYVILLEELSKNGFPLNNPDNPGKVVLNEYWKKKVSEDPTVRCCCRCGMSFSVLKDDVYLAETDCYYHSGRRQYIGGISGAGTYSCCGRNCKSDGCTFSEYHVSSQTSMSNAKFVQTKNKQLPNSSCQVYALDCEMCYTMQGLEVTKISIIGTDGLAIYDKYVLPEHPVVDYNTKYSGITANDLKECTTTLADVQADLLKLLDASTILVGHGLENDLKALRLIHDTIVDTSFVFPHKYGLPYRRSLKSLASSYLKRTIQKGDDGHDSVEDARTCMELMLWKIEFDSHHFIQQAKWQYIQPTIKQYAQYDSQQCVQSDSQQCVQSDSQQFVQSDSQQCVQFDSQQCAQSDSLQYVTSISQQYTPSNIHPLQASYFSSMPPPEVQLLGINPLMHMQSYSVGYLVSPVGASYDLY